MPSLLCGVYSLYASEVHIVVIANCSLQNLDSFMQHTVKPHKNIYSLLIVFHGEFVSLIIAYYPQVSLTEK